MIFSLTFPLKFHVLTFLETTVVHLVTKCTKFWKNIIGVKLLVVMEMAPKLFITIINWSTRPACTNQGIPRTAISGSAHNCLFPNRNELFQTQGKCRSRNELPFYLQLRRRMNGISCSNRNKLSVWWETPHWLLWVTQAPRSQHVYPVEGHVVCIPKWTTYKSE